MFYLNCCGYGKHLMLSANLSKKIQMYSKLLDEVIANFW